MWALRSSNPAQRQLLWGFAAAALAVLAATGSATGASGASAASRTPAIGVIVQFDGDRLGAVQDAIAHLGGSVERQLGVISGVSASLPADALAVLRAVPGVRAVTEDNPVALKSSTWRTDDTQTQMSTVRETTGINLAYKHNKRLTGDGVGIALIDSGVTPVTGLADGTRIVNGPDLSFESQAPNLRYLDTFGHGTHMAGIIAGHDPDLPTGRYDEERKFVGAAPDATLVSVKVAAADGATDVSQVIAGIDWVVQHHNDNGMNIRVLNLSFGTDSGQDPRIDPLSHAVEVAWRSGIVVVAAAGNDGAAATRLSMPALNPYVIAVGAADGRGNTWAADDTVAAFSSRGSASRGADLVAPGKSIVSLRDPGSYIDVNYPSGLLATGEAGARFFKGSGTSQATAVTSGAAALLLQDRPNLKPDQVKKLLTSSAQPLADTDKLWQGAGILNVAAAIEAPVPVTNQTWPESKGTGKLELSRGSTHVADPEDGVELRGEVDIMGRTWSGSSWAPNALLGRTWSGGSWNGSVWTGGNWKGTSWTGRTWSGAIWSGRTWSGSTWSGRTWSGALWNGRTWAGRTWAGCSWSGATWAGSYWSGEIWK